ncbi:MAG: hypothetical protein JXB49_26075, partial [Bacteroidales bacterium]|nr:hypothetical protein [Bacteroidales bacterium]
REVKILKGQTLADIAIQETGCLDGLFDLAITNGISMTEQLSSGSDIDIADTDINEQAYRLVKLENVKPATEFGYVLSGGEDPMPEGIGYWSVGIDFIVS